MIKILRNSIVMVLLACFLTGCGAVHTAIDKKNLAVENKMSATIFLEPVAVSKRTVFVHVKNTSDKPELDIEGRVKNAVSAKGYTLVNDPANAEYILQANVLKIGKSDLRAARQALNKGFEGGATGALLGLGAGAAVSGHRDSLIIGAAVGGLIGFLADTMVKDVMFTAITDIQISQKTLNPIKIRKRKTHLKQGMHTDKITTEGEQMDRKIYQTRIVSTANKVNLKFEEAAPVLITGLSRSIAGIF